MLQNKSQESRYVKKYKYFQQFQIMYFKTDNLEDEKVMCSCLPDFVGNGYTCHGNLWLTLQDLAAERPILMELITVSYKIITKNRVQMNIRPK